MPDRWAAAPTIAASSDEQGAGPSAAGPSSLRDSQQPMAKLVIEDPRPSDEALYKCDVTYVKGKCPSISLVRVLIMSLPSRAQIMGPAATPPFSSSDTPINRPLASGQLIGPYEEREQLKLSCLVEGGRPAPRTVLWRRIDSAGRTVNLQLASSHRATGSGMQQSQLPVVSSVEVSLNHTLSSADLGSRFECHVEHDAIEEPPARVVVGESANGRAGSASASSSDSLLDLHPAASASQQHPSSPQQPEVPKSRSLDSHVFIDLNVGVSSLDLFMVKVNRRNSSESLKEGDLVELECVAYNSRPPANISWFNGADPIEQLDPSGEQQNPPSSNSMAHHFNWHQLQQRSDRGLPFQPADKQLTANNQKQLRHKRLLQRNQVHQNGDGLTYNTHSFLSIKLSRHEHKAQIQCKAQNAPMRQPLVKSLELQVEHAPIVLMEPAGGITVDEDSTWPNRLPASISDNSLQLAAAGAGSQVAGRQVSVYCIYSANPSDLLPNSTRWFKDGQLLSNVQQSQAAAGSPNQRPPTSHLSEWVTPTGYPVLQVNPVSRRDAGLYECQVSNAVGLSERLPAAELCRLEVNFRPLVKLRLFKVATSSSSVPRSSYSQEELAELNPSEELVLTGSSFVLQCEVLEAQPNKIAKFHWYKRTHRKAPFARRQQQSDNISGGGGQVVAYDNRILASADGQQAEQPTDQQQQLIGVTESGQFLLHSLAANFTATQFTCSAFNQIGQSDQSNQVELKLSYTPGHSFVRPVKDLALRNVLLASSAGRPAHSTVIDATAADPQQQQRHQQQQENSQPFAAGRELILECVTPDLGQPRANIWLWLKNGQPLNSNSQHQHLSRSSNNNNNPSTTIGDLEGDGDGLISSNDNPISGPATAAKQRIRPEDDLSASYLLSSNNNSNHFRRANGSSSHQTIGQQHTITASDGAGRKRTASSPMDSSSSTVRLLGSGRYLYVPSIQLVHKGNYSCVAVNRLGSGPNQSAVGQERDSYQLRVALAPSFVQPLASRTYWPEPQSLDYQQPQIIGSGAIENYDRHKLELVCHVQCEPMCQIEWLRNNEPIDFKRPAASAQENSYVTYQVKQSIFEENLDANLFKSVESRLVLQFNDQVTSNQRSNGHQQQQQDNRIRILERRALLNGSNYTCQSSANFMGPPVRSTTKFTVQHPPENVLIIAPSDKLSLVEGSNGPSLSCEASGEPQVQYRWFLLRGGDSSGSNESAFGQNAINLAASSGGKTHNSLQQQQQNKRKEVSQSSSIAAAKDQQSANGKRKVGGFGKDSIESLAGGFDQVLTSSGFVMGAMGANDASGSRLVESQEDVSGMLIELTGSATEQGGGTFSSLDLSNLSLDRKQSGQYICEASNRLGQSRQSVYVNVLYKPTCTTLHLHSLDLTTSAAANKNSKRVESTQLIGTKPLKATANDEYSLVRETSGDFVDLRKILVISPLRHQATGTSPSTDELSFRDSIFQTILSDNKRANQESDANKSKNQLKDTNTLLHADNEKGDSSRLQNLLVSSDSGSSDNIAQSDQSNIDNPTSGGGGKTRDSWDKFNILLLKFLNDYKRKIKFYQEQMIDASQKVNNNKQDVGQRRNQIRRDSLNQDNTYQTLNEGSGLIYDESPPISGQQTGSTGEGTENILTFACMAQDANPMTDLTFDWTFANANLPESSDTQPLDGKEPVSTTRPQLIYSNENYTLHVLLVKRLDTKSSLSPFQMSLVTLNVVVEPVNSPAGQYPVTSRSARQADGSSGNRTDRNSGAIKRSPATRPRYQSMYNSLMVAQGGQSAATAAAQEIGTTRYLDLNEQNWQEQLGNLLQCRVTNQIGTSDACHVRINMAERLRSQGSSSEFAKWRMPTLTNKSLLIISILVGCTLIMFVTFGLLIAPYMKSFGLKKEETINNRNNEDNNTGQSTSSQKSSVLGLLGNGDSSIQGSSDDDSSARLNHIDAKHRLHQNKMLDMDDKSSMSQTITTTNKYTNQANLSQDSSINYDNPRNLQDPRVLYGDHTVGPNRIPNGTFESFRYRSIKGAVDQPSTANGQIQASIDNRSLHASSGSRLLANLKFKSLSKFKVDRISDLPTFSSRIDQMRNLHHKNVSSSETNTTGLSVSALDSELSMRSPTSGQSPILFFGTPNMRLSQSNFRRPQASYQKQHQQIYALEPPYSGYDQDGSTKNQTNHMSPAYSNMTNLDNSPNVMDEFIRQREVADPQPMAMSQTGEIAAAFYRSQSARNQQSTDSAQQAALYMFKNDLSQMYPTHQQQPINRGPPIYPRTTTTHSTYYRSSQLDNNNYRPPVVARTSHRHLMSTPSSQQQASYQPTNRFSMPTYNQSFSVDDNPIPLACADTIDSHLNRLVENVVGSNYHITNHQQTVQANTVNMNPYGQDLYMNANQTHNQSAEHIYDVNAYATPEQTPLRRPIESSSEVMQAQTLTHNERPCVSQLIQSFNSKAPEQ